MKLRIEIEMDNAAFDPDPAPEAARILAEIAEAVEIAAARELAANWERGDLAGAVRHISQWADDAEAARQATEDAKITVIMEGGLIQDIIGIPTGVLIRVHDYDVEGVDDTDLKTNSDGEEYTEAIWGPEPEAKA